jgi:hypothetical protein
MKSRRKTTILVVDRFRYPNWSLSFVRRAAISTRERNRCPIQVRRPYALLRRLVIVRLT